MDCYVKRISTFVGAICGVLTANSWASAESGRVPLPVQASVSSIFDWTGFYVGTHFGYAAGASNWSATQADGSAPRLMGRLDFYPQYDAFKGTGSFSSGLQAGYNYQAASRLLLGVEADISFPNSVSATQTFSTTLGDQASYGETVLHAGSVRGRVGYAFDNWLVYGTGGFGWSFDQFTRTQLMGSPMGGSAVPGTLEKHSLWRLGWVAGAGVELPVAPSWTAKLEYLLSEFGGQSISFPAGAQKFEGDYASHSIRLGLNYQLRDPGKKDVASANGISALETENFSLHGQTTFVGQYAAPFRAPYRGPNSLAPNSARETLDITFYAGMRLWEGAELWINPEIDQGFGLSNTLGVAGFPSGEAYKVGAEYPYTRLQRMFVRQTIDLGGEKQKVESNFNQFAGSQTADRLVITIGKFGVGDVFDTNKYAHDPRTDFLNWSIIDSGAFDYAADAWGYTYGAAAEWYRGAWTLRAGLFDLSKVPNSTELDPRFSQFQALAEIEHRHELWGQPGKIAVTGFLSRGRMGSFDDAVRLAQVTNQPADVAAVRRYRSRSGISMNLEQQLMPNVGLFARAGIADGKVEPYEFADIDKTVAAGLSVSGDLWGRAGDTAGIAGVLNSISKSHQSYFNAGGLGILIGDGQLPNPGLEKIIEAYYSLAVTPASRLTFDYQLIANPAYNRDRGPVSVFGTRLHAQF
ncbi:MULTISPECIES: carbohydrate porin [Nitrobacteraceae]|jgi:high affinity Mn2+ porin|nr:carbohydrate porin [Bradyrhizobium campsiandrae]OUX62487.1 MAG: porin [Afipia sp. TMED4]